MRYDPDLYGPPEEPNEDPTMDDDWETLMETDPWDRPAMRGKPCPRCGGIGSPHVNACDPDWD